MEKSMTKSQKEFKDVSSVKNKVDTKDVIPKTIQAETEAPKKEEKGHQVIKNFQPNKEEKK